MRQFLGLIILLTSITACRHYTAAEKSDGDAVIAHWTFDQPSHLLDRVGAHDGQAVGNTPKELLRDGLDGKAIKFCNGLNYYKVPHAEDLSLTAQFAIKITFKAFKVNGYNTIIWKGDRSGDPDLISYYIDIQNGKLEFKCKDEQGKWHVAMTAKPVIQPDKWYEVIVLWDKGRVRFMVNGKFVKSNIGDKPLAISSLVTNNSPLYIGRGETVSGETGYNFDGVIDDIMIYSKAAAVTPELMKSNNEKRLALLKHDLQKSLENNQSGIDRLADLIEAEKQADLVSDYEDQLIDISAKLNRLVEQAAHIASYRNFFNKHAGSKDQPFIISCLSAAERFAKQRNAFERVNECRTEYCMDIAQNEYEGFQTILWGNPERNTDKVKIGIGDFINRETGVKLPSNAIQYGWIKSIKTTQPDIPVTFVGNIPDVIMDGDERIAVNKADFTPVFIRVYAPPGTPAGVYKGKITFTSGDYAGKVDLNVLVRNFKLPVKKSIKMVFSFFEHTYREWYGYKSLTPEQKMYIYKFLLSYGITPNNIYSSAPSYPSIATMAEIKPLGANFCSLKYITGKKAVSEQKLNRILAGYSKAITDIKKNGLFDDTYFYAFDELSYHNKQMPYAKQLMPVFRKQFPDMKCLQTSFPEEEFKDLFNAWCPLWNKFASKKNLAILQKYRDRGDEIWWYAADFPQHPMPNFFLDYPVYDSRIIMTLSYMYNVKGVLYWSINREWSTNFTKGAKWPEVPWKSYIINYFTKKRVFKNGMGNFVYPGPEGRIYPSLRLENLRDGVEDYEYLSILKKLVAEAKQRDGKQELINEAEKLLTVPADVAVAIDNYSANPDNLMSYRKEVAEMIEKMIHKR